jgi:dTDP-4-dehydrorhamnose reductase
MKVAIFGAKGRLGQVLINCITERGHEVFAYSKENFDVDEFLNKDHTIKAHLDVIINTIAMTDVDRCEENPALAQKINAQFPLELARYCDLKNIKLIHISTDYVFSGNNSGHYSEYSVPEPICAYGESKLQGEIGVLSLENNRNLVIRTAWLFDLHKSNFLTWILGEMNSNKELIKVVADQYGSPTSTIFLANKITELIGSDVSNILHITNLGEASWYQMAQGIAVIKGFALERLVPIDAKSLERKAPRPINTSLVCTRTGELTIDLSMTWAESLRQVLL